MTEDGRVVWSFGSTSGVDRLDRPSLAIRLPNGLIAINDDWRHRVILVDPASNASSGSTATRTSPRLLLAT